MSEIEHTADGPPEPDLTNEQFCSAGDIELCYETIGDPSEPALLLIIGLGSQLVGWSKEFCEQLAQRGFYVIRYDNRDSGRSTHHIGSPPPTRPELITGRIRRPAYTLEDMARDAVGLLDHLEIERAHVVGRSMGGMIAQTLAAQSPERVHSLVSIMSNTGSRLNGQPSRHVLPFFLTPPPADRERYIQHGVDLYAIAGSPGYDTDELPLREMFGLSFDRAYPLTPSAVRSARFRVRQPHRALRRSLRRPSSSTGRPTAGRAIRRSRERPRHPWCQPPHARRHGPRTPSRAVAPNH